MRPGQVKVFRRAGIRLAEQAAVEFRPAVRSGDRQHNAAVHVFPAVLAVDAQALKPRPDRLAFLAVHARYPQAKRPVGEPQPEGAECLLVAQAATAQVVQGDRRFQKPVVVVVHNLAHQGRILGRRVERRVEPGHGPLLQGCVGRTDGA